ncbi:transglycosylase SLT domain-containing protein [Marinibaculum pumilum]|uniref:Transglycosylase SLT domain-containing protein n=2 Tax=Marinibaculum pumilum TaxID=1766165 RepID=A0ABV7L372_9PROT
MTENMTFPYLTAPSLSAAARRLCLLALALAAGLPAALGGPAQAAVPQPAPGVLADGQMPGAAVPVTTAPTPRPRPADAPLRARTAQYTAAGNRISGDRPNPLEARAAFAAVDARRWAEALAAAKRSGSAALVDYVTWYRFTRENSGATFGQIAAFVDAHPEWPWQITLRTRAEQAIDGSTDPRQMIAWFDRHPPVSGIGMIHYGAALIDAGRTNDGTLWVRRGWREGEFDAKDEQRILQVHGSRLREGDHVARLDRQLWDRDSAAATRTMRYVNPGYQALAKARMALYRDAGNVNELIAQVPPLLRKDPGLTYERLRWRRRHGHEDGVREILESPPDELGQENRWWRLREAEVRDALDRGDPKAAYDLAARHGQTDGASYAEAQWLAGWIALRFLKDPAKAVNHFLPMFQKVNYPISKARGAYWVARAAAALGEDVRARQWYAEAALHPTTYYGQLARIALGEAGPMQLPATQRISPEQERAFFSDRRVQVVLALSNVDQDWRARPFVLSLMEDAQTALQYNLVVHLSEMIGRSELSVRAAKAASQNGYIEVTGGYPVLQDLVSASRGVEPALVHAISRQESEFRTDAVSHAGARGIMQLMPATAKEVARAMQLAYDTGRLTRDRAYNAQLGAFHMKDLLRRWNDHYVLAIAAYNAGSGRVQQWIAEYGDPRSQEIDVIDWVEKIPFSETRNYVQRVLEGLQVYRTLMGEARLQLADDLRVR